MGYQESGKHQEVRKIGNKFKIKVFLVGCLMGGLFYDAFGIAGYIWHQMLQ
jgi:hypothetical protein